MTSTTRGFPLEPGTRWTWEGHAYDDDELIDRKVVITVTDLTKVIDGVRARVVWDRDFNDGTHGGIGDRAASRRTTPATCGSSGSIRRSTTTGRS